MHRLKVGDRVQMHPATDSWMRGDRYGDVVYLAKPKVGQSGEWYRVKLDSGLVVRVEVRDLLEV